MAHEIDVMMGKRIRSYRIFKGISQEELGKRLGLSFQQVQKYERGLNRIGLSRFFEISHALGVEPTFFLEESGQGKNLTSLSKEESRFIALLADLTQKEKDIIFGLCRSVIQSRKKGKFAGNSL